MDSSDRGPGWLASIEVGLRSKLEGDRLIDDG